MVEAPGFLLAQPGHHGLQWRDARKISKSLAIARHLARGMLFLTIPVGRLECQLTVIETTASSAADRLRFRSFFEQSPVSTQIFAPDGSTVAVNRAWERLWGVTWSQLGEYNILEDQRLVAKGVMPLILRGFAGESLTIPAVKYEPAETRQVAGAVPSRWVRAFIYAVRDENGMISEVVLTHEDITDQMNAEQARRESEARFRAMFDGAPVGISLLDLEGRYLAVNPARQEMLGYTGEEIMGERFHTVTHRDDLAYDAAVNAEARELGKGRFQLEKRFLTRDGAARWARVTVSMVYDDAGDPQYSVAITEDITAQKEAEEAAARLEKHKEEFLSAVAHDVRTPLTGIRGRVQLLTKRLQRDGAVAPEQLRKDLARIDASTSRISTLISEMLDVANLQIGRPPVLDVQKIDLVSLARAVIEEHQQVATHRVVFESNLPEIIGLWNAARIERMLANLLSNAIKYSRGADPVTVRVGSEAKWAVLSVADRGIGIAREDLTRVFGRFERGRNAIGRIPGTGIGLATVKAIIEEHGGTVSVSSEEGVGTTFIARLPLPAEQRSPTD